MRYTLNNVLSSQPPNPNVGYNNSWVNVETNANRTLYSQAAYITNLSDLTISLSTSNVNIGDVQITDSDTSLPVSVADIGGGLGALRVLSQDLEASNDTISIADKLGHNVSVQSSTSALNIHITNIPNVSSQGLATIQYQLTANTLLNTLTSEINTSNTLLNTLTSEINTSNTLLTIISANTTMGTTSSSPFYVSNTYSNPLLIEYNDTGILDGMGRMRTTTPVTIFEFKHLYDKTSLFWAQTAVGNSFVGFTGSGDSSLTLSAASNGAYAIKQTTQIFKYKPAKSQLCIFTGILNPVSNAIKRTGLFTSSQSAPFNPSCGLYFETQTDSPSSIAVVQNNSGNLVPTVSALRHNWNIDKLDGTGISGKSLNLSSANIFVIDFVWLGVGRTRYGFMIDGHLYYCHEILNAGNVAGAFMLTPNLPFRTELRQTGNGTSNSKLICGSIMTEDGSSFEGYTSTVSTPSAGLSISPNDRRAILGLRTKTNRINTVNQLLTISVAVIPDTAGNNPNGGLCKYEVLLNPYTTTRGVTGGNWTDSSSDGNCQYWSGNNAAQNGITLISGYTSTGSIVDLTGYHVNNAMKLGCSFDGTRDELYLVLTPLQTNLGVHATLTFIETD